MDLTEKIKEYAKDIGFCRVGITDSGDIAIYREILESRGEDYIPWISKRGLGSDPKAEFPQCQSVIVLAYDYVRQSFPPELTKMVGRTYLARCYNPREDSICGARLALLEKFLKDQGLEVKQASNVPVRQLARKAGIASFGKNNFAYVDGVGSFVILYAFLVDRKLKIDEPEVMSKCPKNCRLCIDACPTQAILEPFHIKPQLCVGWNNWMRRRDDDSKFGAVVPRNLREKLGERIHGCDACQEACPRNARRLKADLPKDELLELLKEKIRLEDVLLMDEEYYRRWIYPVMYNYITGLRLFRRNAAIAIGNTGDEKYIPALKKAMEDPDGLIRLHCAWAFGRIGGSGSREILLSCKEKETSKEVAEEIDYALENMR